MLAVKIQGWHFINSIKSFERLKTGFRLEASPQTGRVAKIKQRQTMKIRRTTPKVSKTRAIELAMNLNGVSREIAEKYTDSELREVLRLLKLKANF